MINPGPKNLRICDYGMFMIFYFAYSSGSNSGSVALYVSVILKDVPTYVHDDIVFTVTCIIVDSNIIQL